MSTEWDPSDFNKNLRKVEERRMLDSVLVVELATKRRCPKVTSHLASTITHEMLLQGPIRGFVLAGGQSKFGTLVDYALHVEWGTKHFSGRFYMRGGLRESYPKLRRIWGAR